MKVLVAGGAGFIGSHLIDSLLEEGNEVVCIDNFFIGTKENIEHLTDNPKSPFTSKTFVIEKNWKLYLKKRSLSMFFIWRPIRIFRQVQMILL